MSKARRFPRPAPRCWVFPAGFSLLSAAVTGHQHSPVLGIWSWAEPAGWLLREVCKAGVRRCVKIRCLSSLCGWQVMLQVANLSRQHCYPHPCQCIQKGTDVKDGWGKCILLLYCIVFNHKQQCHDS